MLRMLSLIILLCCAFLLNLLANFSGHTGIAGGQELDLKFENKRKKFNQILDMQRKKTGKLFNFCLQSVVIIAKKNVRVFMNTMKTKFL